MLELLNTKLFIPPVRPELVPRPRLTKHLDQGLRRKLTLISAPAGFGKTTLVSEWIAGCEYPVAWLSLDAGDQAPTRFLTYLVAALQTLSLSEVEREAAGRIGSKLLGLLQSPQPPPAENALISLINEITAISTKIILVLDDYHAVDSQAVDSALTFLLERLPPQMHLVITTREDPDLPLSRLRARGQLGELRANDLRFTPDEAATFLNQVMGFDLSPEEITSLEHRTEGWVAGLQLAALSMQGQDVHAFIQAFSGDHRYILDYLVEEVLRHQSECVRSFLLQTSILERLSGPLCDAVTAQDDCDVLLDSLERSNLFVYPLDDKRLWFRYHHLFADVLQAHLMAERPDQVPGLHRRASEWYAQNGLRSNAIRHALAAQDFEQAANLIELAWSEMDRSRQSATWLDWAQALPEELVCTRPVLSAGCAWAYLDNGELEAAQACLQDAERWLESAVEMSEPTEAASMMVVVDEDEFRFLSASIASARAYFALAHEDITGTMKYTRQALELIPEADDLRRGIPASLLGLASWASGDLEAAGQSLADSMLSFQKAGNILFVITGAYVLADIKRAQGRLQDAFDTYQQYLQLAEGQGDLVLRGTADLLTGLSELQLEWNDLHAASYHLQRSKELGEQADLSRWHFRWCLAQAQLKEAQGDLNGALDLLEEAEQVYVRGPVPDARPIAALKARIWIHQGRLAEARNWARERGLVVDSDLSYLREFEHLTLVRLLISEYRRHRSGCAILEAMRLLGRLLKAAQKAGRLASVIEIQVLQALAHQERGDIPLALLSLQRALILAEPQGYVRIFVDEGAPMKQLLSAADARGILPGYVARLLSVFEPQTHKAGRKSFPRHPQLIEPLSQRELEVLELLSHGLSNREISERLFIALNTVKGHNRKIYGKLQVARRTEAIARARELGLL